ncbi:MAG: hypothetical protein ACXIUL_00700 [Wenzhouxiangella sp.]
MLGQAAPPGFWQQCAAIRVASTTWATQQPEALRPYPLADGIAYLASDSPGAVKVSLNEDSPPTLIPQCLHLLLSQQWARAGVLCLHAGAIRIQDKGVLVVAKRGAGKSILSLSALANQGRVLSDDLVLLGLDEQQAPKAEQLRRFMMFRKGWASQTLLERLQLSTRDLGSRPKTVLTLDQHLPDCLDHAAIDEVWLLKRPRASRPQHSQKQPEPAASALAALIENSMPLLFTPAFSQERQALMSTLQTLLARCPVYTVTGGTDLVETPKQAWKRLIGGVHRD